MDSIILLIGCLFIAGAIGLVFLMVLVFASLRRRNERRHKLAVYLALSHPQWANRLN